MTIRYSSLVALLALAPFAMRAQLDLTVTDVWGTQQNGQAITYYGEASDFEQEVDLHTTLSGPNALTINVRRYELNTVPGSQNYFCWGVCYLPQNSGLLPTWVLMKRSKASPLITPRSKRLQSVTEDSSSWIANFCSSKGPCPAA